MQIESYSTMKDTPSLADGIEWKEEMELRINGCIAIQKCGIMLQVTQATICTAQALFQKIYYKFSFQSSHPLDVGMAVLFLCCKLEENQRRLNDVVEAFYCVQIGASPDKENLISRFNVNSKSLIDAKLKIVEMEREILKETGFILTVDTPYSLLLSYLKILLGDVKSHSDLIQIAWNYTNDSFLTPICLFFKPEAVACALIYISLQKVGYNWGKEVVWWRLFDVEYEDIDRISSLLQDVYNLKELKLSNSKTLKQGNTPVNPSSSNYRATSHQDSRKRVRREEDYSRRSGYSSKSKRSRHVHRRRE